MDKLIAVNPKSLVKAEEWEDFISLWMISKEFDTYNQFFKGDITQKVSVKYGENSLGKFAQAVHEPYQTIIGYRRVARAFLTGDRGLNLSWTHYHLASHTDEYNKKSGTFKSKNRVNWINKAHDNHWSSNKMAQEIKKAKALVKETAIVYYSHYLDKIQNVLTHIDKNDFTKSEKAEFIKKIDGVFTEIEDYWQYSRSDSEGVPSKKRSDSESISKPKMSKTSKSSTKMSKRNIYNTREEAEKALKKQKKKKGSILVRHKPDGKWEVVSIKALDKIFV